METRFQSMETRFQSMETRFQSMKIFFPLEILSIQIETFPTQMVTLSNLLETNINPIMLCITLGFCKNTSPASDSRKTFYVKMCLVAQNLFQGGHNLGWVLMLWVC